MTSFRMCLLRLKTLFAGTLGLMIPLLSFSSATSAQQSIIEVADYESIQDALDAAPESGGVVQLAPGSYTITSPLVVRTSDLTLRGVGPASVIINANNTGEPAFIIRSGKPNPKRKERDEALWRILLTDFRLLGNEKSGHGVHAVDCNELQLRSLTISEHGRDGILMERCFENARIHDCMITYNKGTGLNLNINNHDTIVSANHFEENYDGIRSAEGFNLTMTGNNLDDHLGSALIIEKMMGSVVTGNMLEQSTGWGIVVDRDTYATTFTGNTLTNNAAGGIDLRDAHGCSISANTFSRTAQNALVIRKNSGRLTVSGNTFTNGFVGGETILGNPGESPYGSGITLEDTRGINIAGNTFTAVRPKALSIVGTVSHCVFSNNLLVDCESEADQLLESEVGMNVSMPGE